MTSPDTCPFCGSSAILPGKVVHGEGGCGFRPQAARKGFVLTLRGLMAFRFGDRAHFCPECFMIWSQADEGDARKFLQKLVTDDLKRQLATIDIGGKART